MNILKLEEYRQEIIKLKSEDFSSRRLLFLLNEYLSALFHLNNNQLLSAYFAEYINEYILLINDFEPNGLTPDELSNLLSTAEKLNDIEVFKSNDSEIVTAVENLRKKISKIKLKLEGKDQSVNSGSEVLFPVLEKRQDNKSETGFLEKLSIYIRRSQGSKHDNFIIVPSIGKTEEQLENQIKISWKYAKDFIKESSRRKLFVHEVVIQFDKKYGIYEGESLGIALTIGLIQELIKHYNLRELVRIKGNIVTTGGINKTGNVKPVSREIIQKKIKTVFYSTADIFVIAEEDKVFADSKFSELKKLHPNRKLELVPITKIDDIFNRRDLVEFKKQSFVFWSSKKIIRNKAALFLLVLIVFSFTALVYVSIDNNPASIDSYNQEYHIKNKYGKILWSITTFEDYSRLGTNKGKMIERHARVLDVDNDGNNEVLIAKVDDGFGSNLIMFDYLGNIINKFSFREDVSTSFEKFTNRYSIHEIADIIKIENEWEAILIANHESYYPSFILRLNLHTFDLTGDLFVHSGHITGITVNDIDNDNNLELLCVGISNGYRKSVFFVIELDKLSGTSPAIKNYRILEYPIANFEHYFLLPQSDFGKLMFPKYNVALWPPYTMYDRNVVSLNVSEVHPNDHFSNDAGFGLRFTNDFNDVGIVIGDNSAIVRDRLVQKGKLDYPLTDTDEFRAILKRQIQKWNGKEFVQMFPDSVITNHKFYIQN